MSNNPDTKKNAIQNDIHNTHSACPMRFYLVKWLSF